jgi:oligopeptide/dipeptide ABC transporter ATP-binding protein
LLGSIPQLDAAVVPGAGRARLEEIKGMVPSLANLPPGCRFAPRCAIATDRCRTSDPELIEHRPDHFVACWEAGRQLAEAS